MRDGKEKNSEDFLPKWLRYLLIVLALAYLVAVVTKKGAPPRDDFPAGVR